METLLEALPVRERPAWRVTYQAEDCNLVELLAAIIGGSRQLEIAQDLIAHLGSAHEIARATCDEIVEVEGVGLNGAARIKAALELSRILSSPREDHAPAIRTPEDVAALMMYRMQKLEQEHIYVLLLNTRNHVIGEPVEIYRGSLNSSLIRTGEILRPAVRANAASFILIHNHPSGDCAPSPEDVQVTRMIVEAGKMLDVEALDHIIIGQGKFCSLKGKGLGFD